TWPGPTLPPLFVRSTGRDAQAAGNLSAVVTMLASLDRAGLILPELLCDCRKASRLIMQNLSQRKRIHCALQPLLAIVLVARCGTRGIAAEDRQELKI